MTTLQITPDERETILHNLYDKRQAQAVALMEGDSERADALQHEIDGLNAEYHALQ